MYRILSFVLIVAACGKAERAAAPPPSPPAPAALVHATAADLARDIAGAEQLRSWREVQHRWQGQQVRWTVTRQRALCHAADDCNVAAFPIQRPAQQGWMPVLTFAPGQYQALETRCSGQETCEVTIEATLSSLEISPELPTRVQLANVRLGDAQTARN